MATKHRYIARGEAVMYDDRLWFIQPNGLSCYLFEDRESVGNDAKRCYMVRLTSVRRATQEEIERLAPKPKRYKECPPRHPEIPWSEYEIRYWQTHHQLTGEGLPKGVPKASED